MAGKSHMRHAGLVLAALIVLAASGCAAPRKVNLTREYVLAARYELHKDASAEPGGARERLRSAFASMKSRGFNCVVADFVSDAQRVEVLDVAAEVGLRVYLTDRDLHYYLLTGKVRDAEGVDALVRAKLRPVSAHPVFAGVAVLGGYPAERVQVVLAALEAAGAKWLVPGQGGYAASGGATVAWLDAQRPATAQVSQVERLFHEYHSELLAGWTDGVVVDFEPEGSLKAPARPSLDSNALGAGEFPNSDDAAALDETLPAEGVRSRQFAAESLVRRAQVWGPRLCGCAREAVALPKEGNPAIEATVFYRDQRRYLLVFNQSSEPARGSVRIAVNRLGAKFARAVEVPASVTQVAGEVYVVRSGELVLQPNLRAGDAKLYELF